MAPRPVDLASESWEFEWDDVKRRRIMESRDVDVVYAARIFRGQVRTRRDDRRDYGEERHISIGMVGDECFVVVHTDRGNVRRLITAWKGGRDERAQYQESISRGN